MMTYTGESVWPKNEESPSLYSIGVSLSRIPRFAGHTEKWYSVLCHTFVVAALLPKKYKIHGLVHDAPESCVSDVPTPWKTVAAKKRESVLIRRIYDSIGVELPDDAAQAALEHADRTALAAEAHVLGHRAAEELWGNPSSKAVRLTENMIDDSLWKYFNSPSEAGEAYVDAILSVADARLISVDTQYGATPGVVVGD